MKTALCAAAIGVAMLSGYGLSAPPAQAGYVVDLTQQGSNVVATGSGAIDLTGLGLLPLSSSGSGLLNPSGVGCSDVLLDRSGHRLRLYLSNDEWQPLH
jgi:hypothetical protein